ncbi:uncharacterized protein LOC108104878 [Drosophila eugracilis]|uniref:uncharacterized protein LOC108104878 n=1 Tax=Drosophila eugracilis TaxID=29029 RepID=UPI0007E70805|nr:uncharacterized protein LOC108104878 [Drosophila eugracilis]
MDDLQHNESYSNIGNSFGFVCRALQRQCEMPQVGAFEKYEFTELLKILNGTEKFLLAKLFCQLPANVGSYRVLLQLQKLHIISATQYILCKEYSDQLMVDLIIFFESEFELLEEVFVSAAYDEESGMKLTSMLSAALGNLFGGLVNDPKISNLGYVQSLCKVLPDEALSICIDMHLSTLLNLHQTESIDEAFANFSSWINEGVDELTFVKHLSDKLFVDHQEEALQYLFKQSNTENFKQWKFYIILVQTIASAASPETQTYIKKYLKNRLLLTASNGCLTSLLHLLLTARAASASTMDIQINLDNYAKWYKQNIGEMTYILGADKFQIILALLEEALQYEKELQYLEIHVLIAISPGGRLVQAYKSKCRAQVSQLKSAKRKAPKD